MNATTTGAVQLTGRVSMVTGATGGIGRVIAAELARLGSTVVIVSRSAAAGDQLRRQIAAEAGADHAEVIAGDLSTRAGVRHVVAGVTEDKPAVAARVAYHGLGINLQTATPTPEAVADAVASVLKDDEVQGNVRKLARVYAAHDALAEIERLTLD